MKTFLSFATVNVVSFHDLSVMHICFFFQASCQEKVVLDKKVQ